MDNDRKDKFDPAARREFARVLRDFLRGSITNRKYEELVEYRGGPLDRDDACCFAYSVVWFAYCDLREHKVRSSRDLTPAGRKEIAKVLMLLYSDVPPSSQPTTAGVILLLNSAVSFMGLVWAAYTVSVAAMLVSVGSVLGSWVLGLCRRFEIQPRSSHWPFLNECDFCNALAMPVLLNGVASEQDRGAC